jgi:glycosyltransferase involved in cell wall biosynthesis
MKISYLLASNKGNEAIKNVVDNIFQLQSHDFEVIICSTSNYQDDRAICLKDDEGGSSVAAFNKAYKHSDGDIVITCVDDHIIPENIIQLPDFFRRDDIKKLKFKIANLTNILGGPGKLYYLNNPLARNAFCPPHNPGEDERQLDTVWWDLDSVFPPNTKNLRPYNVFHFAAILRETVEAYMNGVIFNESFIHHYCDSWLGFYEEKINGYRECKDLGPNDIWFQVIEEVNRSGLGGHHDGHDKNVMKKLIEISHQDIYYNTKV